MTIRPNEAKLGSPSPRRQARSYRAARGAWRAHVARRRRGRRTADNPEATASVIGGHNASIAAVPPLAYIEGVQATAGYACTGTVVAPRVVLTAGHCVEDIESSSIVEPTEIAVATGVSNLTKIPHGQRLRGRPGPRLSRLRPDQAAGRRRPADPRRAGRRAADRPRDQRRRRPLRTGRPADDRRLGHRQPQDRPRSQPAAGGDRAGRGSRPLQARDARASTPSSTRPDQVCALDSPALQDHRLPRRLGRPGDRHRAPTARRSRSASPASATAPATRPARPSSPASTRSPPGCRAGSTRSNWGRRRRRSWSRSPTSPR